MIRIGFALAMATLTLAGCGLKGDLERPVPLWGNPPNEGPNDPRTIKAREEAEAKKKAEEDAAKNAPAAPAQPAPQ
jgi:predicted small lipoprotein YifL